jgi:hypothetical protein
LLASLAKVDIADHMEVVMVDIEHFGGFFVDECMRNRPTNYRALFEIDRTFVMHVVQLNRAD